MNILAIDTSTKKANVCLKTENFIIDKNIDNEITHSEKLLPLIDDILCENGTPISSIDSFACCVGPGSFTGIRIGISTIKAFSKVLDAPIFAVSSLDILAYTRNEKKVDYVISTIDSKNSRIYYCIYKCNYFNIDNENIPILEKICEYRNDNIDDALIYIYNTLSKEKLENTLSIKIIGDSLDNYKELFLNKLSCIFANIYTYTSDISGSTLINMFENYAKTDYASNYMKNYQTLDAVYVRPSQAERAKNNEL